MFVPVGRRLLFASLLVLFAVGAQAAPPPEGSLRGATASIALGPGSEEFRLSGFPAHFDEIQIVKVVVGVRYRTTESFTEQLYRIEAAPSGRFRPLPGHDFTTTSWNFYTPLVGAGGPNAPAVKPDYPDSQLLVRPNVTALREVASALTGNPVLPPASGTYEWPALTHTDLAATTQPAAAGRSKIATAPGDQPPGDFYILVTAHVDDVESPAGTARSGEIDRTQSICL